MSQPHKASNGRQNAAPGNKSRHEKSGFGAVRYVQSSWNGISPAVATASTANNTTKGSCSVARADKSLSTLRFIGTPTDN